MMRNPKAMSAIMSGAAQTATAILIAIAMIMVVSGQTVANPAMAKKTGQACAKCHSAPPALNDYGKKYKDSQKK
jgi:nitrate/TMAO reductase-like tetraheme cytochrome c subunit